MADLQWTEERERRLQQRVKHMRIPHDDDECLSTGAALHSQADDLAALLHERERLATIIRLFQRAAADFDGLDDKAFRALVGSFSVEPLTEADIARTMELAREHGWLTPPTDGGDR